MIAWRSMHRKDCLLWFPTIISDIRIPTFTKIHSKKISNLIFYLPPMCHLNIEELQVLSYNFLCHLILIGFLCWWPLINNMMIFLRVSIYLYWCHTYDYNISNWILLVLNLKCLYIVMNSFLIFIRNEIMIELYSKNDINYINLFQYYSTKIYVDYIWLIQKLNNNSITCSLLLYLLQLCLI